MPDGHGGALLGGSYQGLQQPTSEGAGRGAGTKGRGGGGAVGVVGGGESAAELGGQERAITEGRKRPNTFVQGAAPGGGGDETSARTAAGTAG